MTEEQKQVLRNYVEVVDKARKGDGHFFSVDTIEAVYVLTQLQLERERADRIYAHYVIRDKTTPAFVGPNTVMWRVAMKSMAARFTREAAENYIQAHQGEGDFVIEDAV